MADQLTTGQGEGTQASTGNPQTIASAGSTTPSSSVQPGTATDLLRSSNGIALNQTVLPTVNIGAASPTAQTQAPASSAPAHHVNAVDWIVPVLLLLVAIAAFWLTNRSIKSSKSY